jgi:hypothetical protein
MAIVRTAEIVAGAVDVAADVIVDAADAVDVLEVAAAIADAAGRVGEDTNEFLCQKSSG